MGYTVEHGTWDLLVRAMRELGEPLPGLWIADLGSQEIKKDVFGCKVFPARDYWGRHGCKYLSIDTNGKFGAQTHDLGLSLPRSFWERNHLVTNFGCSEHVETSQYWCWRNAFELAMHGGLILHSVPEVRSWKDHCRIWYTSEWLDALAEASGCELLLSDVWGKPPWRLCRAIYLRGRTGQTHCDSSSDEDVASWTVEHGAFPTQAEFKRIWDETGCIDSSGGR
jgi:hypothetical protein